MGVLRLTQSPLCSYRIVCEMGEAKPSQHAGFVEICVAVCRPEFMARSSQLYYFMVSPGCQWPAWVQTAANLRAANAERGLHPSPLDLQRAHVADIRKSFSFIPPFLLPPFCFFFFLLSDECLSAGMVFFSPPTQEYPGRPAG